MVVLRNRRPPKVHLGCTDPLLKKSGSSIFIFILFEVHHVCIAHGCLAHGRSLATFLSVASWRLLVSRMAQAFHRLWCRSAFISLASRYGLVDTRTIRYRIWCFTWLPPEGFYPKTSRLNWYQRFVFFLKIGTWIYTSLRLLRRGAQKLAASMVSRHTEATSLNLHGAC